MPPEIDTNPKSGEKVYNCPFCPTFRQSWSLIDHYWAHLRESGKHDDVSQVDRLEAIKKSGSMYLEWQTARGYNYHYNNKRIAQMVDQTQADNFDWETVLNWTLHTRKLPAASRTTTAEGS